MWIWIGFAVELDWTPMWIGLGIAFGLDPSVEGTCCCIWIWLLCALDLLLRLEWIPMCIITAVAFVLNPCAHCWTHTSIGIPVSSRFEPKMSHCWPFRFDPRSDCWKQGSVWTYESYYSTPKGFRESTFVTLARWQVVHSWTYHKRILKWWYIPTLKYCIINIYMFSTSLHTFHLELHSLQHSSRK